MKLNRHFVFLAIFVGIIFLGPLFFLDAYYEQNADGVLLSPSWRHWLGTDHLGRDLLLRILQGGRISILSAMLAALIAVFIGLLIGGLAAWRGGVLDAILMRGAEVFLSIPSLVLAVLVNMMLQGYRGDGADSVGILIFEVGLTLGLIRWMGVARTIRAKVLTLKTQSYVEAARSLGARESAIFFRHILPHLYGILSTLFVMLVPTQMLYEGFLSFVGLGVQPPLTSWGGLVQEGWRLLASYPHMIFFPSLMVFIFCWLLNQWLEKAQDTQSS